MTAWHKDVRAHLIHAHDALRFFGSMRLLVIQFSQAILRGYLAKAGDNTSISSKVWTIARKSLETLAE